MAHRNQGRMIGIRDPDLLLKDTGVATYGGVGSAIRSEFPRLRGTMEMFGLWPGMGFKM